MKIVNFNTKLRDVLTFLAVLSVAVTSIIFIIISTIHIYENVNIKIQQKTALVSFIIDSTIRESKLYLSKLILEDANFIKRIEQLPAPLGNCSFLEKKQQGHFNKLIVVRLHEPTSTFLARAVNNKNTKPAIEIQMLVNQLESYLLSAFYGTGMGSVFFPAGEGLDGISHLEGKLYVYLKILPSVHIKDDSYMIIGELSLDGEPNRLLNGLKTVFEDKILIIPSMRSTTPLTSSSVVYWENYYTAQFCTLAKGTQIGFCLSIDIKEEFNSLLLQVLILLVLLILFILVSIKLSRKIIQDLSAPINQLIDGVKEIEKGKFGTGINLKWNGQLSYLADSFNRLSLKLQNNAKELIDIARSERTAHAILETVLESIQDPVMVIHKSKIVYANSNMVSLFTDVPVDLFVSANLAGPHCVILPNNKEENVTAFLETGEIHLLENLEALAFGLKSGIQKFGDDWFDVHICCVKVGVPSVSIASSYFEIITKLLDTIEYKDYKIYFFKNITNLYIEKLKAEMMAQALADSAKIRAELDHMKEHAKFLQLPFDG